MTEFQGNNCYFTDRAIFCKTSEEAGLTLLGRVETDFPKEMPFVLSLEGQRRAGIPGTRRTIYKDGKDHSKCRK